MLFEIYFPSFKRLLIVCSDDGTLLQSWILGDTIQDWSSLRVEVYQLESNIFVMRGRYPRVLFADHDIQSPRARGVQRTGSTNR